MNPPLNNYIILINYSSVIKSLKQNSNSITKSPIFQLFYLLFFISHLVKYVIII